MNDKNLDRQADNMLDNVNETISLLVRKIEQLEKDLIEMQNCEESIKLAFDKGYKIGLKDGFISEEKKISFKNKNHE